MADLYFDDSKAKTNSSNGASAPTNWDQFIREHNGKICPFNEVSGYLRKFAVINSQSGELLLRKIQKCDRDYLEARNNALAGIGPSSPRSNSVPSGNKYSMSPSEQERYFRRLSALDEMHEHYVKVWFDLFYKIHLFIENLTDQCFENIDMSTDKMKAFKELTYVECVRKYGYLSDLIILALSKKSEGEYVRSLFRRFFHLDETESLAFMEVKKIRANFSVQKSNTFKYAPIQLPEFTDEEIEMLLDMRRTSHNFLTKDTLPLTEPYDKELDCFKKDMGKISPGSFSYVFWKLVEDTGTNSYHALDPKYNLRLPTVHGFFEGYL